MPLLLRRSAPSPSVDELSLSTRAPPLATVVPEGSSSSSSSQRCLLHGSRASMGRRRSLNGTSDTELSAADEMDTASLRSSHPGRHSSNNSLLHDLDAEKTASGSHSASVTCTCRASLRSSQGSSKRISVRLEDLAPIEDTPAQPEQDNENDTDDNESVCMHERDSTCNKCDTQRDSITSSTSSRVVIRDTQLAALDVELQNLRKSFVKSMYAKISSLSRRLSKRNNTKKLTSG